MVLPSMVCSGRVRLQSHDEEVRKYAIVPKMLLPPSRLYLPLIVLFACTCYGSVGAIQISKLTHQRCGHTILNRNPNASFHSTAVKSKRCALFSSTPSDDSDAKSTSSSLSLPSIAPWARALLIFGVGYGIGGASAPGWQRHSKVTTKIGLTKIALILFIVRDVWRSTPKWIKPRITRYGGKVVNLVRAPFRSRKSGLAKKEIIEVVEEDLDDITSVSNIATKIGGVVNVAKRKLEIDKGSDFNVQASFLALMQLLWQVKSRRASSRDQIYRSSGTAVPNEMLDGIDEMFELADLAYDEHKDGDIKQVLKTMGYTLVKHDTTAVPGYLGHYLAINTDTSEGKTAIIGVKGTSNFEDFLTDMCASAVQYNLTNAFYEGGDNTLRCHEGVFISSQRLAEDLLPLINNILLPSGYRIVIVGHSLGAACATILSILLKASTPSLQEDPHLLKVWAFASPPILDAVSALACSDFVTTVVNNCDIIPRADISPLVVTVSVLRAVDKRLKERNLDMSDFQSSVAFLNFLKEKDGEMLMTVDEIASALENALDQTSDLHDPDHLFVPGKVVLLYNLWEKEQEQMEQGQKETQEFTSILNDWIEGLKDADVHADIELGSVAE